MIKSFRGQVENDEGVAGKGPGHIRLSTVNGLTGYRILKFQVLPNNPAAATEEALVTVWSTKAGRDDQIGTTDIDFNIPTLLAVNYWSSSASAATNPEDTTVIFDTKIINQDIFLTCASSANMNYHLELEQMTLDLSEATVATLKDMRAN